MTQVCSEDIRAGMKGVRGDVCSRCVAVKIGVYGRKDAVEGEGKTSVVENKLRSMVEVKAGSSEVLRSDYMDEDEVPEGTGDVLFLASRSLCWNGRSFYLAMFRQKRGRRSCFDGAARPQPHFARPESFQHGSLRPPFKRR